jgi:hypothetical protein
MAENINKLLLNMSVSEFYRMKHNIEGIGLPIIPVFRFDGLSYRLNNKHYYLPVNGGKVYQLVSDSEIRKLKIETIESRR